jgi:hypothetical protein
MAPAHRFHASARMQHLPSSASYIGASSPAHHHHNFLPVLTAKVTVISAHSIARRKGAGTVLHQRLQRHQASTISGTRCA